MKYSVLLTVFFVGATFAWKQYTEQETQGYFVDFMRSNGKHYDVEETFHRYGVFKSNLAFIQTHNDKHARGQVSYAMAVNKFADLTNNEYRRLLGYKRNIKQR